MKLWEAGLSLLFSTVVVNNHLILCPPERGQSEAVGCCVNSRRCYWLQGNTFILYILHHFPRTEKFVFLCLFLCICLTLLCVYNECVSVCVRTCLRAFAVKWVGVVKWDLLKLRVYGNTGLQMEREGVCDCWQQKSEEVVKTEAGKALEWLNGKCAGQNPCECTPFQCGFEVVITLVVHKWKCV